VCLWVLLLLVGLVWLVGTIGRQLQRRLLVRSSWSSLLLPLWRYFRLLLLLRRLLYSGSADTLPGLQLLLCILAGCLRAEAGWCAAAGSCT
jgi:hypothetical protein